MTCAFSWTKGHLHKHPTPPPPILMGFSEGKLCSDSFIHVVFSKRMSKKFNSPCQHFNIIVIFYLFFIPVHVGLLISDLSISVSKDIRQFYYWNGSFSIPPDHNIFLWPYILVFAVFLGWQYMFFFSSGQSNPTFCLSKNGKKFVLRKKPPGKLLRGAHQVCLVHFFYLCSLIV